MKFFAQVSIYVAAKWGAFMSRSCCWSAGKLQVSTSRRIAMLFCRINISVRWSSFQFYQLKKPSPLNMLLFNYSEKETTLSFSSNYLYQPTTIIYDAQVWLAQVDQRFAVNLPPNME